MDIFSFFFQKTKEKLCLFFFKILLLIEMETLHFWYTHSFQKKNLLVSVINYLEY